MIRVQSLPCSLAKAETDALNQESGRGYRCSTCELVAHRDVVGSVNILSRKAHGELAEIAPPALAATKDRYPSWTGKRSRLDTAELARVDSSRREAAERWPVRSIT
jgi:hypothetical protein